MKQGVAGGLESFASQEVSQKPPAGRPCRSSLETKSFAFLDVLGDRTSDGVGKSL